MEVRSLLKRSCTGFLENANAKLLLKDTIPNSSTTIRALVWGTGGVTGVQKTSFVMLAKSNIAIIFLSLF